MRHPLVALLLLVTVLNSASFGQGWQHLKKIDRLNPIKSGFTATAGTSVIEVTAIAPAVARVRISFTGKFDTRPSWAVIKTPEVIQTSLRQDGSVAILQLPSGQIRLNKSDGRLAFLDSQGAIIVEEPSGFAPALNGGEFRVWRSTPFGEQFRGLGDKPTALGNRAYALWNTDFYGWQESDDPLYKAVPFFIAFHEGRAYGTFLDNTWRTTFDFGKEARDRYSFGADGGELDYYFFFGPTPKDVVLAYTDLTGKTPLPPLWSLGFQQSRYSYYPEARVREIAQTFRAKKIPLDVIYLDIDYQDGNRPFTIDRKGFPNFERMIKDLSAQGVSVITITDLHLKKEKGYKPYDEGLAKDLFVKNKDGSVYVGPVWPGDSVFPDFTLTRAREWWGTLYKDFVGMGVRGFWNDMNEPAVFNETKTMPLDVRHRFDDGTSADHRAIHNIFGMQNVRGTFEGLLKLRPNERPNVLTRATYAGGQRYAATWTGDNSSTWNHYAMSVPQLLNLSVSGYGFVGDDIGGFAGSPPPDLLTRWIELGAFNPIYRDHTTKGSLDQEPWVHGPEQEAIRKRYIELRYELMPYIYTTAEEMSRTGMPMMRPMMLEFPSEPQVAGNGSIYMFGPSLLVAPKLTEMLDAYAFAMPSGTWYDFWTGKKVAAAKEIKLEPKLDELPVFVRGGAVIPRHAVIQHTGEVPSGPLTLAVYPAPGCSGSVYSDDGHTFDYQKGAYARFSVTCETSSGLSVRIGKTEGTFTPWFQQLEIQVFGMQQRPQAVEVDGKAVTDFAWDEKTQTVSVRFPYTRAGVNVTLR
jgi:alpha-glucosidase